MRLAQISEIYEPMGAEFKSFLSYFRRWFMKEPIWNLEGLPEHVSSNGAIERHNRTLNAMMGDKGPSLFKLLSHLKDEEQEMQVNFNSATRSPVKPRHERETAARMNRKRRSRNAYVPRTRRITVETRRRLPEHGDHK